MKWLSDVMEKGELGTGAADRAASLEARHARSARRRPFFAFLRRFFTSAAVLSVIIAFIATKAYDQAEQRAVEFARAAAYPCWPVANNFLSAIVVIRGNKTESMLWPSYGVDNVTSDIQRVKENSTLCPEVRTRYRQKHVTVSHWKGESNFTGVMAACVMHLIDRWERGDCSF